MEREPLAVRAAVVVAVTAVIHMLVVLGVIPLTAEQEAQVAMAVGALGTVVVVVWSRGKVTPVDDPRAGDGTPLVPASRVQDGEQ